METHLDREQIQKIIPQREPILLVDEITELIPGVKANGIFQIKSNMPVLAGHFPGGPILPGVYTVEALAQVADVMLLSLDRYHGKQPLFLGINRASFHRKVLPGETLCLYVEMRSERAEKAIAVCVGKAYAGEELAAECEIVLSPR